MANVNDFEKLYTTATAALLVGDFKSYHQSLDRLAAIPKLRRPKFYQVKKYDTAAGLDVDCRNFVATERLAIGATLDEPIGRYGDGAGVGARIQIRHSSNNRTGSDHDFYFPQEGKWVSIELKLGMATDGAIGRGVMHRNILPVSSALNEMLGRKGADMRRELYADGRVEEALRIRDNAYFQCLKDNIAYVGKPLSSAGQKQMNRYYYGIIPSTEHVAEGDSHRRVVRVQRQKDGSFVAKDMPDRPVTDWTLDRIEVTDEGATGRRLNIWIVSATAGCKMKFVLNWKNNYSSKRWGFGYEKEKVPSHIGLGCASYNMWKYPLKAAF